MRVAGVLGLVVVLGLAAAATAIAANRIELESDVGGLTPDTRLWADLGVVQPTDTVQLTVALKQPRRDELEAELMAVSDPESPRYGKHLSLDRVRKFTAASDSVLARVRAWVLAAVPGATLRLEPTGDFLHVEGATAAQAEALLGLPTHAFHRYQMVGGSEEYVRAPGAHYSVPRRIAELVDFVGGVNRLPRSRFPAVTAVTHGTTSHDTKAATSLRGSASSSSLPSGNNPVVLGYLGGSSGNVVVLPRCSDGSVLTPSSGNSGFTCASGASAADTLLVSVKPVTSSLGPGTTAKVSLDSCLPCSQWASQVEYGAIISQMCTATGKAYGLSSPGDVAYCSVPVSGAIDAAHSSVSSQSAFANGQSSSGPSNAVLAYVEPLVTPAFIRQSYNVPSEYRASATSNSQSVAEFLQQYYLPSDLSSYLSHFNVNPAKPVDVVGYNDPNMAGGEASLDIQVILGVAPGVPTRFTSTSGLHNNTAPPGPSNQEPFLRWIMAINADSAPALVHSVSYSDAEHNMAVAFTDRLNVEFIKAGVRGISLLFATGDDGAPGGYLRDTTCTGFYPTFPPTSPYVTAVGGTQFARPDPAAPMQEVCANSATGSFITSGGGFSRRYQMPQLQIAAVTDYVESTRMPPSSWYSFGGRAYPDISAVSTNFLVYINGTQQLIGGTSASTPTTASIVSLLNDKRLQQGLPPLGFLNPVIYSLNSQNSNLHAFNDITVGTNNCSAIPSHCCEYGFLAAPGWDATTGVGSPNFAQLSTLTVPSVGHIRSTATSAAFTIINIQMSAPGGLWAPNTTATVNINGMILKKQITAGVVKYQLWEDDVSPYVATDSIPYFECDSHGCDPSSPVTLHLAHPDQRPTAFTLTFRFQQPEQTRTGAFKLDIWGADQDQSPYDFDATISYNYTGVDNGTF